MALTDPLGDMLTRIRNGQQAKKDSVTTPASKLRARVLDVLKREGYIRGYTPEEVAGHDGLRIELKYFEGQPAIRHVARVSKPGRRVYSGSTELAFLLFRRQRAFCLTLKRVSRMLAAKCSRRYSDESHR
jgi:small subunit ribosomal protein S8